MNWPNGALAQSVMGSEAVCAPDAEQVKGWTRYDLCVCRAYQARAAASAKRADEADGLMRRAIDEGKAARMRADVCEGGASELRRVADEERSALDALRVGHALMMSREAGRWTAWRGGALGVCMAGLGMAGAAWGADGDAALVLGSAGVGIAGCVVAWVIK